MRNCKICILSRMQPHNELLFFYKCPTCGYTEFDSESYSKSSVIYKYATYKMLSGLEPVPDHQVDKSKELDSSTSSHKE